MWPFSNPKPVIDKHTAIAEMAKETEAEKKERLFQEAVAAIPDYITKVRADDETRWTAAQEELVTDRATYEMSAIRHGDFLLVMMARTQLVWTHGEDIHDESTSEKKLNKSAVAINLAQTKRIATTEGRPPSRDGMTRLFQNYFIYGDEGNIVAHPKYNFDFYPGRSFLKEDHHGGYEGYRSEYDRDLDTKIKGLTVFARSDKINFVGADTVLSVPFGTGETYRDVLLAAIGEGFRL